MANVFEPTSSRRGYVLAAAIFALFVFCGGLSQVRADSEKPQIGRVGESIADKDADFSTAEQLLWLQDHLYNITSEQTVDYSFIRTGSLEEGFTDSVQMQIVALHEDGSKSVKLNFFSGQRAKRVTYPENVTRVRGNPVMGMYMQGDVQEMNRLTDGSWRYFQRRIKLALAENAEIKDMEIDYGGNQVKAKMVTIRPYANDSRQDRYPPGFNQKFYEFVFSDAVPGSLYSIRSVVPAADKTTTEPQLEENLVIAE